MYIIFFRLFPESATMKGALKHWLSFFFLPVFMLMHFFEICSRYSIWLDSKLRLQLDPLLILEYFLWRKGYEFAISNHYDRHCVWEEVAQNKKLNKYNHTVIDQQFAFYRADGLQKFNASDLNKLLPSSMFFKRYLVSILQTC